MIDFYNYIVMFEDILDTNHKFWRNPEYKKTLDDYDKIGKRYLADKKRINILEIGTRLGWSAIALLRNLPREIEKTLIGVDNQSYIKNSNEIATEIIKILIPGINLKMFSMTSKEAIEKKLIGGPFDLIHIDGGHSETGCTEDLKFAKENTKIIVVDDYNHKEKGVSAAINKFCEIYDKDISCFSVFKNLTCQAILELT